MQIYMAWGLFGVMAVLGLVLAIIAPFMGARLMQTTYKVYPACPQ